MKTIRTDIIPATARQAFTILDAMTTPEERAVFLSQSKSEFVCEQHFGLGAWIRNTWIYGAEKGDILLEHPDTISARWLERYYDHLKRVRSKG